MNTVTDGSDEVTDGSDENYSSELIARCPTRCKQCPAAGDDGPRNVKYGAGSAPAALDWTTAENPKDIIRYPWDVAEIDRTETDVEIVGYSGLKISRMGKNLRSELSPDITHLVFRSHMISRMEGIKGMKLKLLELYDNWIDDIRELDTTDEDGEEGGYPGKSLNVLDISYNNIRDMGPVSVCANLQELYIAQNKLKSIKGIKNLKFLRRADFGANRIRVIPAKEFVGLDSLEELWLGKNKIEVIEGLDQLTKLRVLDVQSNRLKAVENLLSQVDTLEHLYLSSNGITVEGSKCETGLGLPFSKLSILDLSKNRLTDTSPFAHLTTLSDIWIHRNDIKTFEAVEPLQSLINLDEIYLEHNPIAQDFEYRKKVKEIIPSLSQIDGKYIGVGSTYNRGAVVMGLMKNMQDQALKRAQTAEALLKHTEEKAKAPESGEAIVKHAEEEAKAPDSEEAILMHAEEDAKAPESGEAILIKHAEEEEEAKAPESGDAILKHVEEDAKASKSGEAILTEEEANVPESGEVILKHVEEEANVPESGEAI